MGEVAFPACRFACSVCRANRAGDKLQDFKGCPAPRTWHLAPYMQACGQNQASAKQGCYETETGKCSNTLIPAWALRQVRSFVPFPVHSKKNSDSSRPHNSPQALRAGGSSGAHCSRGRCTVFSPLRLLRLQKLPREKLLDAEFSDILCESMPGRRVEASLQELVRGAIECCKDEPAQGQLVHLCFALRHELS